MKKRIDKDCLESILFFVVCYVINSRHNFAIIHRRSTVLEIGNLNSKLRKGSLGFLTIILCMALCLENISMTVWAAEPAAAEDREAATEDDFLNEGASDQEEAGESESGDGVSAGGGENGDPNDEESDRNENAESESGDGVSADEGDVKDPEEGTDTPVSEEKPEEDSEEEPEQISENTLDTISENTPESISENNLDEERQALIKEAEAAFEELLSEKPLMALLYHTDQYGFRKKADENSAVRATLEIGQTLYINAVTITENDVWYQAQYWLDGTEGAGYVQSAYLAYSDEDWLAWEEKYLFPILTLGADEYESTAYGMAAQSMFSTYAADTSDISAFPGAYQDALRSLKSAHPNWTFVPMKTGLDFNTAVSSEMGAKSLIQKTDSNASKGWVGDACPTESGWYYATKPAVSYHMDPRNFLTESYIFQFEQLTFNSSYHTESAVQGFLNGTFMKGTLSDDTKGRTYARAFYEIGSGRKLSPIHLAARVYQEQGQGTSGLISGTYAGYEGYYNYFNVGVNGSSTAEKIRKGLEYAKSKGWNTRYKSLEGGAATIGNNYILKYQDTIYLEKFNVDKNSPYGVYNHQYMQNIQAPAGESASTRKMYSNAGSLNSAFVFKIPVYDNMPNEQYYPALSLNKTSLTMDRGETQQLILSADGVALNGSEAAWKSSDLSVATVENGLVKAEDKGEAVITAVYREVEVSCKVTVKIPLQSISLDKAEIRLRRQDTVVADTTGLSEAEKAENTATAVLRVSFDPADTTADKSITWTSSDIKIAAVKADAEDSSNAVVSAVGTGEVTITAKASKAGNKTASCKVYVSAPIYRLVVTNRNAQETDPVDRTTLFAGQSINLSAEYWPKDTTSDTRVSWSSSDEKVAVVKNGKVTAVGEDPERNTAVITARMAGCEKGYEASYTIVLERCTVTFMRQDGNVLGTELLSYGGTLSEETIREKENSLGAAPSGSVFIGWYTGRNGTGSRFDENTPVHEKNIILYPYYVKRGEGFYVLPIGDQIYTGSAIKPKLQVYDGTINTEGELLTAEDKECFELVEGRDYTVSYKNNKNVNQEGKPVPTVTVKGKGNYTGTQQVTFRIIPKALTDTDITADDIIAAYNGRTIKGVPTVYRNGEKLIRNADYTVTYPLEEKGAYQTPGIHPVVITGKGGYTGKLTVYENITKEVLLSKVSVSAIPKLSYSNEQIKKEGGIRPASLEVTYKKEPLVEERDYTVSYSNDQSIGKATVTLTAVDGSGYIGSKSVTYQIVGTSITRAKVEGLENKQYVPMNQSLGTESAAYERSYQEVLQTSGAYRLTIDDRVLVESTNGIDGDYVVSYAGAAKKGEVKAGTATIVFKGINEYSGQLKKSYRILPCEFKPERVGNGQDITVSYYTQDEPEVSKPAGFDGINIHGISTPYVKGGSKPTILLSFRGQALTPGRDYSISYRNNNALTTAEMEENKLPAFTITGKGNFKGKLTGTFAITDGRMKDKVAMTLKDVVYREKKGAYRTKAVLRDVSGKTLVAGRDYDKNLEYTYYAAEGIEDIEVKRSSGETVRRKIGEPVGEEDIPQTGTAIRVTAKGTGLYQGTGDAECSAVYRIVAADFTKVKVKVSAKTYQDGRPVFLTAEDLTLTVNGTAEPLVLGKDYIIENESYTNHTKKGKAKVTLRGIGNYGGEKTVTYTIGAKKLWW